MAHLTAVVAASTTGKTTLRRSILAIRPDWRVGEADQARTDELDARLKTYRRAAMGVERDSLAWRDIWQRHNAIWHVALKTFNARTAQHPDHRLLFVHSPWDAMAVSPDKLGLLMRDPVAHALNAQNRPDVLAFFPIWRSNYEANASSRALFSYDWTLNPEALPADALAERLVAIVEGIESPADW